jgi:hypothetical protein
MRRVGRSRISSRYALGLRRKIPRRQNDPRAFRTTSTFHCWMLLQQAKDSDLGRIGDPAVRGSSLWLAYSLMASYHEERVRPRHRHGLRRLPRGAQGWPRECRLGLRRIFDPDGSISFVSVRQEYRTAHKSLTAIVEIIDLIATGERQPHHCLTLRVLFARRLNRNVRTHRGSGSGGIGYCFQSSRRPMRRFPYDLGGIRSCCPG